VYRDYLIMEVLGVQTKFAAGAAVRPHDGIETETREERDD
jgi:hypothetical protein